MKHLGEAINGTRSESDEIANVIGKIKDRGFDVFLAFEATIGFQPAMRKMQRRQGGPTWSTAGNREPEFQGECRRMIRFLKSLRISVDEVA